jgi:hypothetical protein
LIVRKDDIEKVRTAGYGDAEILEIIAHVALNTFTNYVNEALGTEIDFSTYRSPCRMIDLRVVACLRPSFHPCPT